MKRFKGVWRVHLKSATAFKHSGEAQPLVHDGVIYLSTGANDVFALDVKSVYLGMFVGTLVTMNAGSGRGLWSAAVGDWQVRNGGGTMPPFSGVLSAEEIAAVAHDVVDQIAPKA